jgi:regulator of protease activity HflC (stomatin/prohibitin superfamily)
MVHRISGQRQALLEVLGSGYQIVYALSDFQVTTAEGDKSAAILQAEGRLEASRRDASAKIVLAEASQTAIEKVTNAIHDNDLPIVYLLGEKYIEALKGVSSSPNAKIVLLPGDLPAAIRGLLGAIK